MAIPQALPSKQDPYIHTFVILNDITINALLKYTHKNK